MRPPDTVMRLARLGSFHQTRLSLMRVLLRRMALERWTLARGRFDLNDRGVGVAVYTVTTPRGVVHLIGFGHELAPEERTDRVIATKWDATFVLTTAEAGEGTIERLRAAVPLQEAGRCSPAELVLSRANKSVRLFEAVVSELAAGRQPAAEKVTGIGYLMRTTAVYGNGKYGLSDLDHTFGGGIFSRPFEAELLTVFLIREFTFDLAAHLARVRAPVTAVALTPESRRMLGIGNATGLGMAPFLIGHPILIDRWMTARETAIARVRAQTRAGAGQAARFHQLLARAIVHLAEWQTADLRQMTRIETLRREMPEFQAWLQGAGAATLDAARPWDRVAEAAEARLSVEGQELVNSLILEPQGAAIDDLADSMTAEETLVLDPAMSLADLVGLIEANYAWALTIDYDDAAQRHLFWYVSADKLEPRLGERFNEPGAEQELPIGIGRECKRLHGVLTREAAENGDTTVAELLLREPGLRRIVRRVQGLAGYLFSEIRDNLLARDMVAVDLLRCKLSMFGAIKFDPKSDRWTRITMYQGAPGFDDLDTESADDWAFPAFLD